MSTHTLALAGAVLSLASMSVAAEKRTVSFDAHRLLLGPEVVIDAKDGSVRLAHSVLYSEENGETDFRQTEELSDRVWAKQWFNLPGVAPGYSAELFVFGKAKEIEVNGTLLAKIEPLTSTGWTRAKLPAECKLFGSTNAVLRGGGQLLLEPRKAFAFSPNIPRSVKSTDSGRTWQEELGRHNNQIGTYLVRLRLGRYAWEGWALSGVFDLWADPLGGVSIPGKRSSFHDLGSSREELTELAAVSTCIRTGSTPVPDDKHWTHWENLSWTARPADSEFREADDNAMHRWAQLKIKLRSTGHDGGERLPRRFALPYDFQPDITASKNDLKVVRPAGEKPIAVSAVPFIYQEPSPRLKLLRERYQLDKVIAPGKTEMEQLMLLRHWVRNQWHTAWGSHPAAWMPPWDALIILESKDQPDCLTMCTHYACVFTQCCLALGWNARHCILDHHCVAEVWVDQHQKWVMMDAGNSAQRADVNLHFERNGVPMSALELHLAHRTGKTDGIQVCFTPARLMEQIASLCRPEPPSKEKRPRRPDVVPLAELKKYPVCQLENYRRYALPGRNNYLTSLLPGELYQGWSEYFYDGYWWVGDSPDDPQLSPEYSRHLTPSRPQDIDWSLNWTRIHLCRTDKPGEVRVDLETGAPNFARFERRASDKDAWQATAGVFTWKLEPGKNTLRARSVNQWDRAGAEASVQVEWKPADK